MWQENIEVVRRALRHISDTGEPDLGLYDPDIVWTTRSDGSWKLHLPWTSRGPTWA